jgi:FSR family fosmidomycin resistance protein-like MFS transporter
VKVQSPTVTGAQIKGVVLPVLVAISFCHFLNDLIQSLLPAIYPILKASFHLDFTEVGFITLAFQLTASILQPFIGYFTDRKAQPYSLAVGMFFTLCGLVLLSRAQTYPLLLVAAALIGTGSSIFHPESSRVARMSSGGRHGFAQSFFQVGGNTGSAMGPLLAAYIILPYGQHNIIWFSLAALLAMVVLSRVGRWYGAHNASFRKSGQHASHAALFSRRKIVTSIAILAALVFSKYFYLASITSYYTFYLITTFHVSVRSSQIHLFLFLGAVALGTFIGGPLGDRIGRKYVIWGSILGVLPFTLMLPYANLFWTSILSVIIGLVLSSAFSAILVYAQELVPGKVGTISGLFFGFAFGMASLGAAILGKVADMTSITFVYHICSYLPAIGLLAAFLPNLKGYGAAKQASR